MGRKKTTRPAKKALRGKSRRQNSPHAGAADDQPRALQLFNAGHLSAAREAAKEWAAQEPDASLPWHILGGVESLLDNNQAAAAAAFRKEVARAPEDPLARSNLAGALALQGKNKEALDQIRQALRLRPDFAGAENVLGNILRALGETEQAAAAYRRALAQDPAFPDAHLGLGNTLWDKGQAEGAEAAYKQALKLRPQYPEALAGLGKMANGLGKFREAIAAYREVLAIAPFSPATHSDLLLSLHYDPDQTAAAIFREHERWREQQTASIRPFTPPLPAAPPDAETLRIGIVGSKFHRQPNMWFSLGAFEVLANRGHTIYVYDHAGSEGKEDDFTQRLQTACQAWRDIAPLGDEAAAKRIREDAPDILINMATHPESRLRIFAHRAAPIQVQWKGNNTTGLKEVDWFIGDWVEIPPGEEQWFTEQVYRLPDDYIAYLPPDYAPDVGPLPMKEHAEGPTFGSFNNPAKVNEQIAAVWARILEQVPGSRLLLKGGAFDHPQACQRIRNMFAEQGVDSDRLILEGPAPHNELLDAYNRMDIALDPWPYSGGLTTLEALWMGVPVISLPGPTFAGRHAATHLVNAGLSELVATDADDYVTKAVAWADDPEGLAQLRGSLRDQLAQSPVCDQGRFTNNLEEAFRYMIHQGLGGS